MVSWRHFHNGQNNLVKAIYYSSLFKSDNMTNQPIYKGVCKDTRGLLQKLLSFRYQKPNQIPIEGTVSNPEFEPNQISEPEPDENRSSFDHGEVD